MKINHESMTAEISLMENAVYVVKDGKPVMVPRPETGYGKSVFHVHWQAEKPTHGKMITPYEKDGLKGQIEADIRF